VSEVRFRHVNENNEIEKNTKRDAEGQKSNTRATPNRESNNVEISEKKEREKEGDQQGSLIPKMLQLRGSRRK
jgi:hypothetical protein